MSVLQDGKFGHGFVSTGIVQSFAGPISSLRGEGLRGARVAAAAIVGGTASELTGGRFANGAMSGAFSRMFNDEADEFREEIDEMIEDSRSNLIVDSEGMVLTREQDYRIRNQTTYGDVSEKVEQLTVTADVAAVTAAAINPGLLWLVPATTATSGWLNMIFESPPSLANTTIFPSYRDKLIENGALFLEKGESLP